MTVDDVILLLSANQQKKLTPLQELVLRASWDGKTYTSIATEAHYGAQRIREVAAELWRSLSDFWGEPITKANFRETFEWRRLTRTQQQLIETQADRGKTDILPSEYPSGPVALNSHFYISRPPIEELAYTELAEPGCLIRIQAPRKMGKSSLVLRIMDRALTLGYRVVSLDFLQADRAIFSSLDRFLRWFAINISRQLLLEPKLDTWWDRELGSKTSCSLYFQSYILTQIQVPLLITLNEVNCIFEYPEIAGEFFLLLRFWHEQTRQVEVWQKFRLVVAYSTEFYIPSQLHQSLFNTGLPLNLEGFNQEQVQELAQRHGLPWTDGKDAKRLIQVVGGHPYLTRLALYYLCQSKISLRQLLQEAVTDKGIYTEHLRELTAILEQAPTLQKAFQKVISSPDWVKLEPLVACQLNYLGLVVLQGDCCSVSCELYRWYFVPKLLNTSDDWNLDRLQLKQENQSLEELANKDNLSELANRRYFERYLEEQWLQASDRRQSLALILGNVDYFKFYNEARGYQAGDDCLRLISQAISQITRDCADLAPQGILAARYRDEEFAILMVGTEVEIAGQVAEKIRRGVRDLALSHDIHKVGGLPSPFVTMSLGVVSEIPTSEQTPVLLLRTAQQALYRAKREGRDRVVVHTTTHWILSN